MVDTVPLRDISNLITKGTTPSMIGDAFTMRGVNFIKSESLSYNGTLDVSKFAFIGWETHKKLKRSQILEGDILYSIAGVNLGKICVAESHVLPANTNQAVAIIRIDRTRACPYFVFHFLRNPKFVEAVLGGVAQSAQPNVNLADIGRFQIPNILKSEQKAIASILNSLDDKVELNRQINETLEAMARAVFKDWFVDFGPTRAKAEGRPPYLATDLWSLFPDRLDDDGKPKGWKDGILADIVDFNPREPLKVGFVAPYLDMAALPTSGSIVDRPVLREFTSGMRFRNGDTLFARITPCLENGKAAFVQGLPDNGVGWGSTEFIVLRSKYPVPPAYTYLLARDPVFRATAIQSMTGTSGRQRARSEALEALPVVNPGLPVWRAFDSLIHPAFERISANGEESRTLATTRDLLLPKLMSGEIRIEDAEKVLEAAV